MSQKPYTDVMKQLIAGIEADAKMTPRQKSDLLNRLEGLIGAPAAVWRHKAAGVSKESRRRRLLLEENYKIK